MRYEHWDTLEYHHPILTTYQQKTQSMSRKLGE
jgi:hypothetical protein